jgi:tetratricopeptide (TPR) repeat protein
LAALFFAVHPAHVEAVAWVSGRKDLLATFFSLLAILSYCSPRWGALTAVFGACACLSKPTPFVLPLLVLIVEAVRENDGPRPIYERVRLIPFFSLVIVCVMLAGVHFAVGFSEGVIKTGQHVSEPRPVIIIAILAPLAEALRLLVFPVNLSPLYTFQGDQILPAIPPLSLLSTLGFVLLIIWCARTRDRVIAFGLLWLAVAYLPTCNLIPTSLPLAERYLYFPSLGFCICLARMFTASPRPRVSVSFSSLAALLVVLLCIGTWVNNARWRDSLSLWRWGAEVLPSCPEVWNDLATAYSQAGLLGRTRAALELSAATGWQRTPRLHLNRGLLLMKEGNYSAAVKDLLVAAEDAESAYKAHYHLGQAYEALTMSAEAIWEYKLAISLDPNAPAPHNNLGVIYERRRNLRTALKEYAIAIARDPSYALAYYNLGNLEMQQKHFASAETLYRKAIDLDPDHAMSHNNLAALLLDRGETQAAQEEFELAARLDPSLLQPILALAFIDAAQGRKDAALDKARRALQLDPKNVTALRLINKLER